MKLPVNPEFIATTRRSRKGAWIEIAGNTRKIFAARVAPVRERGLKFAILLSLISILFGRSRKGAWIEIHASPNMRNIAVCRSRKGAWIEITPGALLKVNPGVAPVRERGLK